MVDPHHPDLERYPRFAEAMKTAEWAELEPGDAIYIPYHWWHGVDSLDPVNLFINYWWSDAPAGAGGPYDALMYAFFALKLLPPEQREVWRMIFDHYVFCADGDPGDHLPEHARGHPWTGDARAAQADADDHQENRRRPLKWPMREWSSAAPSASLFWRPVRTRFIARETVPTTSPDETLGALEQLLSRLAVGTRLRGAWHRQLRSARSRSALAELRPDHQHAQAGLARHRRARAAAESRGRSDRVRHRRQRRGAGRDALGRRAGLRRFRLHHRRHGRRRRARSSTASRRAASPIASSATSALRGFPATTSPAHARSTAIASKASPPVLR